MQSKIGLQNVADDCIVLTVYTGAPQVQGRAFYSAKGLGPWGGWGWGGRVQ